jgi:urease subunit gamma/beta
MYLSPTEEDRLRVFMAAQLARRVFDLGLRLNAPEAVALICDEMHMAARSGASYEEVAHAGQRVLSADQVMAGVPDLVPEIRLEVLLEEGTRLITVNPWGTSVMSSQPNIGNESIGGVRFRPGTIHLLPGRERQRMRVTNTSTHPVRVSSHFPFWRANPRLRFDRNAARGFRLDILAGSSIRWHPGETLQVDLVAIAPGGD